MTRSELSALAHEHPGMPQPGERTMKSLSKSQSAERLKRVDVIREAQANLQKAIDYYNAALSEKRADVEAALEKLNEAIADADSWRSDINSDQEIHYEEKSEKWQESDAGLAYQGWKDEWENEFEQAEIEFPDELEMPDNGTLDELENLPDDPG